MKTNNGLTKAQNKAIAKERLAYHKKVLKLAKENEKTEKIAPEDAFISLRHIDKIYPNHVQAVFDFNLDIKEGEFIVFVGPSGCGKSTTLRMIAGLEDITYGDLFIDGVYANQLESKDRSIGMVFQSYALYPHMTVYENMAFALRVNHVSKDIIDEKIRAAAETLQLTDYLQRKPAQLSGGQCQRVALGRAIVSDAKVFLMDEPLSNLDAKLRVAMRSEIVKLHQKLKTTTVYVTHDQTEAMTMADRIVVMSKGYVQQIGTPAEIYNHPSNMFVATFVGSPAMNIIPAKISGDNILVGDSLKLKLTKDDIQKIDNFYDNEINKTLDQIENLKVSFYEREIETKKYKDQFNGNTVNKNKALKYLTSIGFNDTNEIDRLLSIEISEDYKNALLTVLRQFLLNKNAEENPEIGAVLTKLHDLNNAKSNKDKDLFFGIRPEHIEQVKTKDDETLELQVTVSELLGNEYFLHFDYCNEDLVCKLSAKEIITNGQKVCVKVDRSRAHIFDPISKKTIF